jgi:hypothetical protein
MSLTIQAPHANMNAYEIGDDETRKNKVSDKGTIYAGDLQFAQTTGNAAGDKKQSARKQAMKLIIPPLFFHNIILYIEHFLEFLHISGKILLIGTAVFILLLIHQLLSHALCRKTQNNIPKHPTSAVFSDNRQSLHRHLPPPVQMHPDPSALHRFYMPPV